jgi:hypothetical protein
VEVGFRGMYVMQRHVSFLTEDGIVSGRVVKSEESSWGRESVFVHTVMVAACPATTHPCSRRALVDPSVAARLGNTTLRLVAPSAVIDTSRNCRLMVVAGWGGLVEDGCWWLCCLG